MWRLGEYLLALLHEPPTLLTPIPHLTQLPPELLPPRHCQRGRCLLGRQRAWYSAFERSGFLFWFIVSVFGFQVWGFRFRVSGVGLSFESGSLIVHTAKVDNLYQILRFRGSDLGKNLAYHAGRARMPLQSQALRAEGTVSGFGV